RPATAIWAESGANATAVVPSTASPSRGTGLPVAASRTCTTRSKDRVTTSLPSGLRTAYSRGKYARSGGGGASSAAQPRLAAGAANSPAASANTCQRLMTLPSRIGAVPAAGTPPAVVPPLDTHPGLFATGKLEVLSKKYPPYSETMMRFYDRQRRFY